MFEYRWLVEGDYEDTLVHWWKDWRITPPPKDFLPDEGKYGIMVYNGDVNICAGFIYPMALSKVCFVEFIISDFKYRDEDRLDAISYLVEAILEVVKVQGYKYTFSCVKDQGIMGKLDDLGFVRGTKDLTTMVGVLK